jgi:glutamate carboxypeptidase
MPMKMHKFLLLLFCCCAPVAFANSLTAIETQLQTYVTQQQQEEWVLLKKLVNVNSGTANIKGVNRIAAIVTPYFKQLGFRVRLVSEPKAMHRAKTLIAERTGKQGKHVLLIAHLDTVFPNTSSFKKFELKNNTAKGPGVTDDKGGIVVILYALKALQAAHVLDGKNITVVLTGDEEDSGKPTSISRKPLFAAAKNADVALDFEPAISMNTATIARRGISMWTLEAHGKESHSASIFQEGVGDGAIFELTRILNTMRLELSKEKYLTFNPGVMIAGTKIAFNDRASQGTAFGKENVISPIALAKGDLRFLNSEQEKATQAKMEAIVKKSLPGTHASMTFKAGIPAMPPTAQNTKLLEEYSLVSTDLGQGPVKPLDPQLRGAGDISHIASIVPANLSGLGPVGFGAHSENEHIELASLPIQTARAAIFIYRLTK